MQFVIAVITSLLPLFMSESKANEIFVKTHTAIEINLGRSHIKTCYENPRNCPVYAEQIKLCQRIAKKHDENKKNIKNFVVPNFNVTKDIISLSNPVIAEIIPDIYSHRFASYCDNKYHISNIHFQFQVDHYWINSNQDIRKSIDDYLLKLNRQKITNVFYIHTKPGKLSGKTRRKLAKVTQQKIFKTGYLMKVYLIVAK